MINIITTFYISKTGTLIHDNRTNELFEALQKNMGNTSIKQIHLFLDDMMAYEKIQTLNKSVFFNKIIICGIKPNPKHIDFFNYAIHNLSNEICMIINSDIYLYEIDENLLLSVKNDKIAYALSRYEWDMSSPQINRYLGSHDGYIFIPNHINNSLELVNFYPNIPGIESHIITFFVENNYKVFNPCFQIKIVHLHKSNIRNYKDDWIGLHNNGDENQFFNSVWCIPPIHLQIQ